MKRSKIMMFIAFLSIFLLIGCQQKAEENQIEQLIKYKDSYIGDNSAVGNIAARMAGSKYGNEITLQTKSKPYSITIQYKLPKNASKEEKKEFERYWTEENMEKAFLFNATTLFMLVKNVDEVILNLDAKKPRSLTITRQDIEAFYGTDVKKFAASQKKYHEKVFDETINSEEKVESFYKKNPIE